MANPKRRAKAWTPAESAEEAAARDAESLITWLQPLAARWAEVLADPKTDPKLRAKVGRALQRTWLAVMEFPTPDGLASQRAWVERIIEDQRVHLNPKGIWPADPVERAEEERHRQGASRDRVLVQLLRRFPDAESGLTVEMVDAALAINPPGRGHRAAISKRAALDAIHRALKIHGDTRETKRARQR